MKLTQFQTPLAERAIGAAAAAVFLAGIISAGIVESGGVPGVPALAAPANVGATNSSHFFQTADHVTLPTASSATVGKRVRNLGPQITARDAAPAAPGGTTVSQPPSSSPGSTAPRPNPPGGDVPDSTDPTPSVGVAVGPIAVGASPEGVGGSVGATSVGDPSAAPDQTGGV